MNPALLGLIRGVCLAAVTAILVYLGDATHLTGILNPVTASILAASALALEHYIEEKKGTALFGAVKTR